MQSPTDSAACSGFSRRSFFRFAAGASALATMPILTESQLAMAARPHFSDPNKGIHIDANENPMGPSEAARLAMIKRVCLRLAAVLLMGGVLAGLIALKTAIFFWRFQY